MVESHNLTVQHGPLQIFLFMSKIVSDDSNFICVSFCLSRVRFAEYNNQITREGSLKKKNVFFRHCLKQGGGLHGPLAPWPNSLALFHHLHFWSIKVPTTSKMPMFLVYLIVFYGSPFSFAHCPFGIFWRSKKWTNLPKLG